MIHNTILYHAFVIAGYLANDRIWQALLKKKRSDFCLASEEGKKEEKAGKKKRDRKTDIKADAMNTKKKAYETALKTKMHFPEK